MLKVLFVDERIEVTEKVSMILYQEGIIVKPYRNVAEATLEIFENHSSYNVLIFNLAMTQISGIELYARVRSQAVEIPIIIISDILRSVSVSDYLFVAVSRGYTELIQAIKLISECQKENEDNVTTIKEST